MIKGIDVSSYQDSQYPTAGYDFVFVKATEGTSYINPKQDAQTMQARDHGLALGFYHFLHPGNIGAQAEYFVQQCDSVYGDMLVVDWETTEDGSYASCAEKDQFLAAVRQLRPAHHRIGLYCNSYFWLNVDTTSESADFLWIAAPGTKRPPIQHPWLFWQTGENGGLDQNVCALESRAALRTWCGYAG
ncbi:GH25 family lysozyme [Streptomyces sp. NPDC052000]|uniref:glycoside hydrolase family 25 protein n=1 Tax=Streptomyces sp. NPDC052000 TaxID=3155676 RepID=UPI00344D7C09